MPIRLDDEIMNRLTTNNAAYYTATTATTTAEPITTIAHTAVTADVVRANTITNTIRITQPHVYKDFDWAASWVAKPVMPEPPNYEPEDPPVDEDEWRAILTAD